MRKNDRFTRAERQAHLKGQWTYDEGVYWSSDMVEEHQWMGEVSGKDLDEWAGNSSHISRECLTYDIEIACPQYDWRWDGEQGKWEYERSYIENEEYNRRQDRWYSDDFYTGKYGRAHYYYDGYDVSDMYDDYYDEQAYLEQKEWEEEQAYRDELEALDDPFDAYYAAEYARERESVNSYGMPIEEEEAVSEFEYERRREHKFSGRKEGIRQHLKENEEMYGSRYNERREPVDYDYINDRVEVGAKNGEKWDDVQSELLAKAENWRERRYIREDAVELSHEVGRDGRLYVRRFCGGEMFKGAVYVGEGGVLMKYGERRKWRKKNHPSTQATEWIISSTVVLAIVDGLYYKYIYEPVEYVTLYGLEGSMPTFRGWFGRYKDVAEVMEMPDYKFHKLVTKRVPVHKYSNIKKLPDKTPPGEMRCIAKRQVSTKEANRLLASARESSNGVCKHTGRRSVKLKIGDGKLPQSSKDVQLEYVEPLRYYSPIY